MSSTIRQPRARVLCNGKKVEGCTSLSIENNGFQRADTFRADFALTAPGGQTGRWWGEQDKILIDIRITLDDAEPTSLIVGEVTDVELHEPTGLVSLTGRDLTGRFIDAKIQEAFQNRTASEIVTILAERRGLTPVVTKTSTMASRYYERDHDRVQHDQFSKAGTEWNLLCQLAQFEGFDVFVKGTELHFQAKDSDKTEPFKITTGISSGIRTSNVIDLRLRRSLTLAKDVTVAVRSWNSRAGRAFVRTSGPGALKGENVHRIVRANLTEDQAQKLADSTRAEITAHERLVTFAMPGEISLTPRRRIMLEGTDSSWDQLYFIDAISRSMSFNEGFMQNIRAKNRSTDGDTTT